MHMLCLITYNVGSENGYGFLSPGLKTGVGNDIFWSEIGSGFGDAGGTKMLFTRVRMGNLRICFKYLKFMVCE